jgi:two-component system, NtrC family, sensor histidine kinase HydH
LTQSGYALIGLTLTVAVLAAILTFALLRFVAAARATRSPRRGGGETALLSAALEEAVARLRTQEQAMNARAAASEELSGQIVDSLTSGLLVVDRSGRVEMMNLAARRLLGVTRGAAGSDYHQVLASAPPLVEVIAESLATGRAIVRRAIQLPETLPVLHLGVTVSPLTRTVEGSGPADTTDPGSASTFQGVICLFADLTNVVELEEQLRLKDSLARVGELTAGIAHEFRNGLATIHGYSRLIDPDALPAPYKAYIEGIRQEAEALGKVVTNFLSFARPEQVVFARVDLGAVATRAADDLRHELPPGTSIDLKGQFGIIQGDDVLLRQMFSNLVRNAGEACQAARITPSIVIAGDVDADQRLLRVVVSDNGPGIRDALRARIFQPFFTTRAQGTGLGLAIVQKVVVTHGGKIAAGSSPTGGASFEMTFPLAEE